MKFNIIAFLWLRINRSNWNGGADRQTLDVGGRGREREHFEIPFNYRKRRKIKNRTKITTFIQHKTRTYYLVLLASVRTQPKCKFSVFSEQLLGLLLSFFFPVK